MKRVPLIALVLCALTLSPVWADDARPAASPLGTFSYDFGRLGADEASQISALKSIGYAGMGIDSMKLRRRLSLGCDCLRSTAPTLMWLMNWMSWKAGNEPSNH